MRRVIGVGVFALGAAVAAAAGVVASSRGDDERPTLPPEAVQVADRFMSALVTAPYRDPHIDFSIGVVQDDMLAWRSFLDREGVDTIRRGGEVQEDCAVPFPIFLPQRQMIGDCVVYEVGGRIEAQPIGPAVMTGRMRVWLIFTRGAWRVAELDFTPRNGFRSLSKAFYVEGY
jgi:hypothetical protein